MILNLWSEDQEGPVKIYSGGPRGCFENIHQHCMYLALTACVFIYFWFNGDHYFEWHIVVWEDRLIDSLDHFEGGSNTT